MLLLFFQVINILHGCAGSQTGGSLPPPPWEAQSTGDSSPVASAQYPQPLQVTQVVVTHAQAGSPPLGPQPMGNDQVVGMYIQPITGSHMSAINSQVGPSHQLGYHPQQMHGGPYMGMLPQPMQAGYTASMYPQQMYGQQMASYGYGYGQQQGAQYLDRRMYGLSVTDDNGMRNSYQLSTSSYVPPSKPSKPEDKLFGDLVDMAKLKPTSKPTPGRAGSM